MNILFVISQLPYPLDTGAKIRSFNLIKNASQTNSISLLAYGGYEEERRKIEELRKFCNKIELVTRKRINPHLFAFTNLFSRYSYSVAKYYSRAME